MSLTLWYVVCSCEPLTGRNKLNRRTSIANHGNTLVREIDTVVPICCVQENTLIILQSSYIGKPPITGSVNIWSDRCKLSILEDTHSIDQDVAFIVKLGTLVRSHFELPFSGVLASEIRTVRTCRYNWIPHPKKHLWPWSASGCTLLRRI